MRHTVSSERLDVTVSSVIEVASPDGCELLRQALGLQKFLRLLRIYETQQNLGYCGVASSVMALNLMSIEKPTSPQHAPFQFFDQCSFFTESVATVKTPNDVKCSGYGLTELGEALSTFPVAVTATLASDVTEHAFRTNAIGAVEADNQLMIINYSRRVLGQEGGGHFSPLSAYHEKSDRLLILDVARYKYPPVWVTVGQVFESMKEVIADADRTRGYVVVTTDHE